MPSKLSSGSLLGRILQGFLTLAGTGLLTAAFFLVLPLIQVISKGPPDDLIVRAVDAANLPPPPPPPEEEPEPEEEQDEPPPDLAEEAQPLDLAQLEIALDPGFGSGSFGGNFTLPLDALGASSEEVDELFSLSDLDQKPRATFQPSPQVNAKLRQRGGGTVYILFVVDQRGRVENPIIQSSPDPLFDRPALDAIKKWRFEPGKRKGEPVRFRMRVPMTFPNR